MSAIKTHYDNLQVARNASPEVIRAAYKGLTQRYHPDRNSGDRARCERIMKIINHAYEVLSDPARRREHDEWISAQEAAAPKRNASAEPAASRPTPTSRTGPTTSTASYIGAAQAFRESRINSTPHEDMQQAESPRSAVQSPHAAPPEAQSSRPPSRPPQKPLVTWRDWLAGICALACLLAAWPTWDTAGPILLFIAMGLFVWLFVRGIKQQASIEASRCSTEGLDGSSSPQTKPTIGGEAARPRGADDVAFWLTASVWGWLAYALTPHHLGSFLWTDYAVLAAVLLAAWIPAYGACCVLLAPGNQKDLTWKGVSGYLFLAAMVVVTVMALRGSGVAPLRTPASGALRDATSTLPFAHYLGLLVGALLGAAVVTAILITIGAAGNAVARKVCEQLKMPSPRTKVTALLVGWAAIPVALALVRLANWVP